MVHTVQKYFSADDTKRLIAPSRRDRTVWRIETDRVHLYEACDFLKDDDDQTIASVTVRRPRLPSTNQLAQDGNRGRNHHAGDRENDVLITLANANTDQMRFISDDDITRKLVEAQFGNIKKKVQQQPAERGSTLPGKNKYVVLEVQDRSKIPPFFQFFNEHTGEFIRMYLNYRGKPRWCKLCSDTHADGCPELEKIKQFERERDQKRSAEGSLPVKIYASSVGRLINQKALYADVDSMSGGVIGNLVNAVSVDEKNRDVGNLIIMGGGNDLHRRMPPNEFVALLDGTKKKITDIPKEKKIAIVPPPLPQECFDSLDTAKEGLFMEFLGELEKEENVMVWENPVEKYDDDFGSHPSATQTKTLVDFLDKMSQDHFGVPLKVPSATDDTICSKQKYGGVNPLYIFGCGSCNERTRNKWRNLCDGCTERANEDAVIIQNCARLNTRAAEIFDEEHPALSDLQQITPRGSDVMETSEPAGGMLDDVSSEEGDLTCPLCSAVATTTIEFHQHFKQQHPEEKPRSLREKAKFFQDDVPRK